jgi:hypothetical protein
VASQYISGLTSTMTGYDTAAGRAVLSRYRQLQTVPALPDSAVVPAATPAPAPAPVTIEINSGNAPIDQLLATILRKYIRVQGGGNVQLALGN